MKHIIDEILQNMSDGMGISYAELVTLHDNRDFIKEHYPDDPFAWEMAGIPEEEYNKRNVK